MINEEQATRLRASDDANGNGAAGKDFGFKLVFVEWALLPLGLIGALVVADCDESPCMRKSLQLSDERVDGHGWGISRLILPYRSAGWRVRAEHL